MRAKIKVTLVSAGLLCAVAVQEARAWRGGSFHAGGFSGGAGSVHYAGASHYGPATGFTHVGGATYSGAGGTAHYGSASYAGARGAARSTSAGYASYGGAAHYGSVNYGSIQHYNTAAPYGVSVYHGPAGGTAVGYRGPYGSGAAVKGPAGYGAAAVKGPAGGTAAVYRGPYTSGAVAALPSGYTATAWRGTSYYHSGYSFYRPTWYAGAVSYVPVAPPVGFFFGTLPPAATTTVVNNNTYYMSDGTYYQPSSQNGQQGYAVVDPPPQATTPPQAPSEGSGAPDPLKMLQKMSDWLGAQKSFRITVAETSEQVVPSGQKVQVSTERVIFVKRPDKASVNVYGPGVRRHVVCDGSTFTAIDLNKNVYATMPMQGTLDSVMDKLAQQYGMTLPVEDLLYSDVYSRLAPMIQTGQFLGPDTVAGRVCNHFAYAQAGVSWQLWVDAGDQPVPRKIVISYDSTPGRPKCTLLVARWDAVLQGSDDEFKVTLPEGAVQASITMLAVQAAGSQ
jgi:hypothetical protein